MSTADKASGNFFCVPTGKESPASTKESLNKATDIVKAMRASRVQYQKKIEVKGMSAEVANALSFSQSSNSTYKEFSLPFESIDLSKLSEAFISTSATPAINLEFINDLAESNIPSVDAIFVMTSSGKNLILHKKRQGGTGAVFEPAIEDVSNKEILNRGATISKGEQSKLGFGVFVAIDSSKKVFIRCQKARLSEDRAMTLLSAIKNKLIIGSTDSFINIASVKNEIFGLVPAEVSVYVEDTESLIYGDVALDENAYKYFSYEGQGVPNPVASSHLVVPNDVISSPSFVKMVINPAEGYGPEFKGIRPPGTPDNFMLTYTAENYTAGQFLTYLNKLIAQDVESIANEQGTALEVQDYKIPLGILDRTDTRISFDVVALKSNKYTVNPVSYDRRPNRSGKIKGVVAPEGTTVVDSGPFDQRRGVFIDGSVAVKSAVRPEGKDYDDRLGSIVPVYAEEIDADLYVMQSLDESMVSQCLSRLVSYSEMNNVRAWDLQKLIQIAMYRIDALASGKYKPYVDLATLTMMFNLQHGKNLLDAYNDDPASVADSITNEAFEAYRPTLNSPDLWNVSTVKGLMSVFGYSNINDLPQWSTGDEVANKDRFVPYSAPSSPNTINGYGLEFNTSANLINWRDNSVEKFSPAFSGRRRLPINLIILHWGGTKNGASRIDGGVYAVLSYSERSPKSTHFIIRHSGQVAQHEDLNRVAWHVRGFNFQSIGIDTASPGFPSRMSGGRSGARTETFTDNLVQAYKDIGYSVIQSPLTRSVGGIFVAPLDVYENLHLLLNDLTSLPASSNVQVPRKPAGLFTDSQGRKSVYVTSGIVPKFADSSNPPVKSVGIMPHMYLNRTRIDDIVSHIYDILRYLGDDSATAYRRLVLTLESQILHTTHENKRVNYLVLSRG